MSSRNTSSLLAVSCFVHKAVAPGVAFAEPNAITILVM